MEGRPLANKDADKQRRFVARAESLQTIQTFTDIVFKMSFWNWATVGKLDFFGSDPAWLLCLLARSVAHLNDAAFEVGPPKLGRVKDQGRV